jgi:hypothetical protein
MIARPRAVPIIPTRTGLNREALAPFSARRARPVEAGLLVVALGAGVVRGRRSPCCRARRPGPPGRRRRRSGSGPATTGTRCLTGAASRSRSWRRFRPPADPRSQNLVEAPDCQRVTTRVIGALRSHVDDEVIEVLRVSALSSKDDLAARRVRSLASTREVMSGYRRHARRLTANCFFTGGALVCSADIATRISRPPHAGRGTAWIVPP